MDAPAKQHCPGDGLKPCRLPPFAEGDGKCVNHAAAAGVKAARDELSKRGRAGRRKQLQRKRQQQRNARKTCSLRTPDAQLNELERLVITVEGSGEPATMRANAITRIV